MQPEIYVYISGGNLQGISATENIHAHLFDQDNLDAEDTDTVTIHNGEDEYKTPEQWDAMIAEKTKAGEIIGIY
jgi:Cu/Zn superoxide dismutase